MAGIATSDELMAYLDVGGDNPARVNKGALELALNSAETWVQAHTGRVFRPEPAILADGTDLAPPVTKVFPVRNRSWVRIPDLRSTTAVSLNGVAYTENTDYIFDTAASSGEPYTMIRFISWTPFTNPYTFAEHATLSITGRWGFYPVPADVKDAVLSLAARQYRRRDAMFSDIVDVGTGIYEYRAGIPAHVREILRNYRMPLVAFV